MGRSAGLHLDIDFDARETNRFLGSLARQVPFALKVAINETLKDMQKAQRAHQRRVFTVRRPSFVDQSVKIKPFASKQTLTGTMSIDPPGGHKRADILTKFERGGIKRPRRRHLVLPVKARRTRAGIVSTRNRPKALKLRRRGRSVRGERRTFVVRDVGIFQRVNRGRRSRVRLLFAFLRQVPIDRRLDFVANAERTVARRFDRHFDRAFDRAVRTAR